MKNFVNKETEITKEVDGVKSAMGYADLALVGLNSMPKEGWTTDEMRKRFRVIDKMETVVKAGIGKSIDLEDADFDTLVATSKINWAMMHKDLIKFDDYLQELKNK